MYLVDNFNWHSWHLYKVRVWWSTKKGFPIPPGWTSTTLTTRSRQSPSLSWRRGSGATATVPRETSTIGVTGRWPNQRRRAPRGGTEVQRGRSAVQRGGTEAQRGGTEAQRGGTETQTPDCQIMTVSVQVVANIAGLLALVFPGPMTRSVTTLLGPMRDPVLRNTVSGKSESQKYVFRYPLHALVRTWIMLMQSSASFSELQD